MEDEFDKLMKDVRDDRYQTALEDAAESAKRIISIAGDLYQTAISQGVPVTLAEKFAQDFWDLSSGIS
jgi:hypothetical protein